MKNLFLAFFLLVGALSANAADQILLEGAFNNSFLPAEGGVTFWSGGNYGKYPDASGSIPAATNGSGPSARVIQLAESSFGQMVAQNQAFPGAVDYLISQGNALLVAGTPYKRVEGQTGDINLGGTAWDIRFPGVIDQFSGTNWVSSPGRPQNYFPDTTAQAERAFRASLRINPYDLRALQGLLGSVYEQMAPLLFAANNNAVYASRRRLTSQNALTEEIPFLDNAVSLYRQGAGLFIELASRTNEVAFLTGTSYFGSASAATNEATVLIQTFGRSLSSQAEMVLSAVRLKYYAAYLDPVLGSYNPQTTLAYIADKLNDLQAQLLVAGTFTAQDAYRGAGFSAVEAAIGRLQMDRDAVRQGRVFFSNKYSQADYAPHYVPFLWDPLEYAQFPNSFRKLIDLARTKATDSSTKDSEAGYNDRNYDIDSFQLQQRLSQIQSTYRSDLGQLCGQTYQTNAQQVAELSPDILFALLPPGDRELRHNYAFGESKGQIYAQYVKIDTAELQYMAALTDLTNALAAIQKKQDIAAQVAQIYNNTASLILSNGERIVTLDQQIAEIQAEAARAAARAQAKATKKAGIASAVGSAIAGAAAILAGPPGWATIAAAGASGAATAASGIYSAYAQAGAIMKVGNINADSIKQIAEIEAQKTRIRAMESAAIQFQARDIELLKTEEMVFSMMLDAERSKLNIMMAKQQLDMAEGELANLISRVSYLLQEYQKSLVMESYNPLSRSDYRLLRDIKIREAEDTFAEAQEWAYLAAKAGEYRVNGAAQAEPVRLLLRDILAARNGSQLYSRLSSLGGQIDTLFLQQGSQSSIQVVTISVRNFLVQNNYITGETNGIPGPGSMLENQGNGITSDQHWANFLLSHSTLDQFGYPVFLGFSFSTSLNPPNQAGDLAPSKRRKNPLFNATLFDALITYSPSLQNAFGMKVNIKGRGLSLNPSDGEIYVDLLQTGASYIRGRSWQNDADGSGLRVWNLLPPPNGGPAHAQLSASINGAGGLGTPQFHERSAANDGWVLSIDGRNGNNAALLEQLDQITDIELIFSIRGF